MARALIDTAAIFYRLRLLGRISASGTYSAPRAGAPAPPVAFVGAADRTATLDYPALVAGDAPDAEIVAVLAEGARPAGNWVTAAVPYFASPAVAAVVAPSVTPPDATPRERSAAAVLESRLGGGSRRSAYLPGNVGVARGYGGGSVVVRRRDWQAATEAGVPAERIVSWLADRGRITVYTPDTLVAAAPPPLFAPHLRETVRRGCERGAAARRSREAQHQHGDALLRPPARRRDVRDRAPGGRSPQRPRTRRASLGAVGASAGVSALRFRSAHVGLLAARGSC